MPPKKETAKKGKKKKPVKIDPWLVLDPAVLEDPTEDREFDARLDVNEGFIYRGNKLIEWHMRNGRHFDAHMVKKYFDVVIKLHGKYCAQLEENEALIPQVAKAERQLRYALQLSENMDAVYAHFRELIEQSWRMNDAALFREQETAKKLTEMYAKFAALDKKSQESGDDDAEFGALSKYKNIILRERDRLNGEVIDLEKRLQYQRFYAETLEYINKVNDDQQRAMNIKSTVMESEKQRMAQRIRSLLLNNDDLKDMYNMLLTKFQSVTHDLTETTNKLILKTSAFDSLRQEDDKLRSEASINRSKIKKLHDEIKKNNIIIGKNETLIKSLRLEDRDKARRISTLEKQYQKSLEDISALSTRLTKLNKTKYSLDQEIVYYKNRVSAVQRDFGEATAHAEEFRKAVEDGQREREKLRNNITSLNTQITDNKHILYMQTVKIDGLKMDTRKLSVKLDEAVQSRTKAEKERDEMTQQVESLLERIDSFKDLLEMKTNQISLLTEQVESMNRRVMDMKKQLEAAHTLKQALKRDLETTVQERDDFRLLVAKLNFQAAQFTNEVAHNYSVINSLNIKVDRLNSTIKELHMELINKEKLITNLRQEIKDQKHTIENLLRTIVDDEKRLSRISAQLEETTTLKSLVGLQMVRRNDEIMVLKEKLIMMQTGLDKGQAQYNQRVEDIRILKTEVINLQHERETLTRSIKSSMDMRAEVILLTRLLNEERVKVRALVEDAKVPTGVHRWRVLKGEDPSKFELIEKARLLQKRNMKREMDNKDLERKLKEACERNDQLQKILQTHPGPEIKKKLVLQQRFNRRQTNQLKAVSAQLMVAEIELQNCNTQLGTTDCNAARQKDNVSRDVILETLEPCIQ